MRPVDKLPGGAQRDARKSLVQRASMNGAVVFAVTLCVRLLVLAYRVKLETLVGFPLDHPSLRSLQLRPGSALDAGTPELTVYKGSNGEQIAASLPFRFALFSPVTEARTWRELVYWHHTFATTPLPAHLTILAPWYVRFFPYALAFSAVVPPALWLSVCDALTALLLSRWPSCSAGLLYGVFILNPCLILPTIYASLTSLELGLVAVALDCHRRAGSGWRCVWRALSIVASAALGSDFVALVIAAVFPLHLRDNRRVCAWAAGCLLCIAVYATTYCYATRTVYEHASLYAPPDLGATWYARQLILPMFAPLLEVLMLQLPPMLTVFIAAALPHFRRGVRYEPLLCDSRTVLFLFALGLSVFLRNQLTLPYCFAAVLFFYAALNPRAHAVVQLMEGVSVTYTPHRRVRIIVAIIMACFTVAAEVSLYYGWVLRGTANANWIVFVQLIFMLSISAFLATWYNEIIKDAAMMEREANEERASVEATHAQ